MCNDDFVPPTQKQVDFLCLLGGNARGLDKRETGKAIQERLDFIYNQGLVFTCPYCRKMVRTFDFQFAVCPHCKKNVYFCDLYPYNENEIKDVLPNYKQLIGYSKVKKAETEEYTGEKRPDKPAIKAGKNEAETDMSLFKEKSHVEYGENRYDDNDEDEYEEYDECEKYDEKLDFTKPKNHKAKQKKVEFGVITVITYPFFWPFYRGAAKGFFRGILGAVLTLVWWFFLVFCLSIYLRYFK